VSGEELTFLRADALPGLTLVSGIGVTRDVARHLHASFCFGVVLDGRRALLVDGREHEAAAGDVLVVEPGRVHAVRTIAACSYHMFSLEEEAARRGFARIDGGCGDLPCFPVPVLRDRTLAHVLEDLAESFHGVELLEPQSLFWQVMALLAQHGDVREFPVGAHSELIVRIREMLEERLAENVTLSELARACQLDEWSLCRVCVRETGLPPHALLLHLRLKKARELFAGGHSAADVAAACGFFDQSHLHRHFMRQVGMTPGRYASAFR